MISLSGESALFDYATKLQTFVRDHEKWRTKKTLNLIPSENFASERTRSYLSSDLSNRYSARDHFYKGTKFADEIENLAVTIAKKLYRAKFADVRALSGHTCSLILFLSFLKPQDKVLTCPPESGGYPGSSAVGLGGLLGLENLYFPYDAKIMNIIPYKTRKLIASKNPEMTIFGSSFIPFPYDLKSSIPNGYSGVKVYDGSHVMGLIAGGTFQQPLKEGASILIGSTHKTLFGPQGGLILSNDESLFSVIDSKVYPGIVDNIHWNRVAGLAFALIELAKFGRAYSRQVIRNSRAMARALDEMGASVKCSEIGYTKSHQVLLGYNVQESNEIAQKLEMVDIISDTGIRLGTSEITRRGMKEREMNEIAQLIVDAISGKESSEKIRRRVHRLVSEFSSLEYCLK